MQTLLKTNEPVLLSYVQSLLSDAGIPVLVADQSMSLMEGSVGVLPRRVQVAPELWAKARLVLIEAGLKDHLAQDGAA